MLCPYCRSENRPGATKCAFCASWMVEAPPVREWFRPRQGRMIAGVCRGLADRFGLPVAAWRLAFLLSLCFWGMALIAYVALWIAMPNAPLALPAAPSAPRPAEAQGGGGGI